MPITSFEVGSVFVVKDNASQVIAKVGKAVAALDKDINSVQANLLRLSDIRFTPINNSLMKLGETVEKINKSLDTTMVTMTSSVDVAAASVRNLQNAWRGVATAVSASGNSANTATRSAIAAQVAAARSRSAGVPTGSSVPSVFPWGNPYAVPSGSSVPSFGPRSTPMSPAAPPPSAPPSRWARDTGWFNGGSVGSGGGGGHGRLYGGFGASGRPHVGFSGGGLGSQAAAGLLGLGVYHNINVQDLAEQAILSTLKSDADTDPKTIASRQKQFTDLVTKMSPETTFSQEDVGQATLDYMRLLGPKYSWDEKMKLMPSLLKDAALDARFKKLSLDETAKSFTFIGHQAAAYTPEAIDAQLAATTALSTMTDKNPEQMARFFSYALPIMGSPTYGFDKLSTEQQAVTLMQGGLGSKSGTWLRQLGTRLVTPIGKVGKWKEEMKYFGLIDDQNKFTFYNDKNQPDVMKALKIMRENTKGKNPTQVRQMESRLLGIRGMEGGSMLGDPARLEQIIEMGKFVSEFMSKFEWIKQQYNSTSIKQEARTTWQDFNAVLTNLSSIVLPGFSKQLESLSTIFTSMNSATASLGFGQMGGAMLMDAVVGFALGGPAGAAVGAAIGAALGGVDFKNGGAASLIFPLAGAGVGAIAGAIIGAMVGGPAGAILGAKLGASFGGLTGLGLSAGKSASGPGSKVNPDGGQSGYDYLPWMSPMSYYGRGVGGGLLQNATYYRGAGFGAGGFGGFGGGSGASASSPMGHFGGGGGKVGTSATMPGGPVDSSPVPGGVLSMAAKLAGDPGKLQKFMSTMGYPKSGAWCGEFASSVIRRAGGIPPSGSAIASNWRNYGTADTTAHVGDIAVRNGVRTGSTGSHVGFVTKVNPDGSFVMEGGNQGGHTFMKRNGGYSFRSPPANVLSALTGTGSSFSAAGKGAATGGDPRGMIPFIRATAQKYGIDPNVAVKVAQSEGLAGFTSGILGEKSYGAFQLHVGGGLGDSFRKETGLNPADPKNERATIDYALRNAKAHGWSAFHGAHNRYGWGPWVGIHDQHSSDSDGSPSQAISSHHDQQSHETHINLHVDGRKMSKVVHKHTARMGNMPSRGARLPDPMATIPTMPM